MLGRSQVSWWVRRAEHEVRCEMEPAPTATTGGCYLILYIDGHLANCGFHPTRESLLTCAFDLRGALTNIVWDDSINKRPPARRARGGRVIRLAIPERDPSATRAAREWPLLST